MVTNRRSRRLGSSSIAPTDRADGSGKNHSEGYRPPGDCGQAGWIVLWPGKPSWRFVLSHGKVILGKRCARCRRSADRLGPWGIFDARFRRRPPPISSPKRTCRSWTGRD